MLLENLALHFDRQEKDKLVFKTDAGQEVFFAGNLLDSSIIKEGIIYLNIDNKEISGNSSKDVLNDILDS